MTQAYVLSDVSFGYGKEPVLRVPFLELARGRIAGLVGPNGSGKTTLLHVLAFLENPQKGSIEFFGQPFKQADMPVIRRKVALLLQNPYLFNETVLANVGWGLRLRSIAKEKAKEKARKALETVGLKGFDQRYARSLSGGESQRVALARALVLEPAVLLLDEPFNHMDREAVRLTEEVVVRVCREYGTTVIFTSHAVEKLQAVAHTVIHLWQGRIAPTGPDNLFKGTLSADRLVFDTGRLSVRLDKAVNDGDFIAIDPSGITISLGGPAGNGRNCFSGKVASLSDENGRIRLVVDAGERLHVLVDNGSPILADLRLGTRVKVTLKDEAVSLL